MLLKWKQWFNWAGGHITLWVRHQKQIKSKKQHLRSLVLILSQNGWMIQHSASQFPTWFCLVRFYYADNNLRHSMKEQKERKISWWLLGWINRGLHKWWRTSAWREIDSGRSLALQRSTRGGLEDGELKAAWPETCWAWNVLLQESKFNAKTSQLKHQLQSIKTQLPLITRGGALTLDHLQTTTTSRVGLYRSIEKKNKSWKNTPFIAFAAAVCKRFCCVIRLKTMLSQGCRAERLSHFAAWAKASNHAALLSGCGTKRP